MSRPIATTQSVNMVRRRRQTGHRAYALVARPQKARFRFRSRFESGCENRNALLRSSTRVGAMACLRRLRTMLTDCVVRLARWSGTCSTRFKVRDWASAEAEGGAGPIEHAAARVRCPFGVAEDARCEAIADSSRHMNALNLRQQPPHPHDAFLVVFPINYNCYLPGTGCSQGNIDSPIRLVCDTR